MKTGEEAMTQANQQQPSEQDQKVRGEQPEATMAPTNAREWLENEVANDYEYNSARHAAGLVFDAYSESREAGAKELTEIMDAYAAHVSRQDLIDYGATTIRAALERADRKREADESASKEAAKELAGKMHDVFLEEVSGDSSRDEVIAQISPDIEAMIRAAIEKAVTK